MTENLLARHPLEAVRLVALEWLGDAIAARARLADTSDGEALHDFRVAIRRLRSTERAFRDALADSVSTKDRRRLRRVASATSVGRDAEVQIEWVDAQRASLYSRHRPGALWFRERLRARKAAADGRLHDEIAGDFDRVAAALRTALPQYTLTHTVGDASAPPRFADALATRVRAAAIELAARLGVVTGPGAVDEAHEARIAAKRLRYLLEPVAREPGVTEVVKSIKALQESLGELHDLDVVAVELTDALAALDAEQSSAADDTAAERDASEASTATSADDDPHDATPAPDESAAPDRAAPPRSARDPRPGLLSLARRGRTRREALYHEIAGRWFAGAAAPFFARVERVAQSFAAPVGGPSYGPTDGIPREIERKYLLRGLPPRAREVEPLDVAQGWIPGETLRERVRRVRDASGDHFYRTVKLGRGLSRIELDEETTAEIWSTLWPLTTARRITKRRYRIPVGELTWEIDAFDETRDGPDLVIAEVELPDEQTSVEIPEWLAPYVVRDVTDESGYTNYQLAGATADG